jgi:hypothetical protein
MKETKNFGIHGYSYRVSQFNRNDYRALYNMSSDNSYLRQRLIRAKFRDKKFQRALLMNGEADAFYCDFDDLPCFITDNEDSAQDIVKWRLKINK